MSEIVFRGPLDFDAIPRGAARAVRTALHEDTAKVELARLTRGLRRLTVNGIARIGRKHSGICPMYTREKLSLFRSIDGLLWWDDAVGITRQKLIALAWRKGAESQVEPQQDRDHD